MFDFSSDGDTLVSYVPQKNKNVVLISSLHDDQAIDISTGEKEKPEIISFYNSTKLGVDIVDKMCGADNVRRTSKRWPMVIFFTMLNIGTINSQIIYVGNGFADLRRRFFIKQLANELMLGQLSRRSLKSIGMPAHLQQKLKRYAPTQPPDEKDDQHQIPPKRRRCGTCTLETGQRRLSQHECKYCRTSTCISHAIFMCPRCYKTQVEQIANDSDE